MELEARLIRPAASQWCRLAVLTALGFLAPGIAWAQPSSDPDTRGASSRAADHDPWSIEHFARPEEPVPWKERARADELLREARAAARAGDCSTAVPQFAEAYRVRGQEAALRGAVDCAKDQQRWAEAYALIELLIANHGTSPSASADLEEVASHTGSLVLSVTPVDAEVMIDGTRLDEPSTRLPPGKHAIRVSKQGYYPVQQVVELTGGSERVVAVKLKRAPPQGATAHFDQKQVIDFCRLASGTATDAKRLQRLVLFAVGGAAITQEPEGELDARGRIVPAAEHRILESARAHDHLRDVFASTFPSNHFYTVQTRAPGPVALAERPSVSAEEMIGAASIDPFAGYSIACADWVAIPRVTARQARWRKVEKQRQVAHETASYEAWTVDVNLDLEVDVYRRAGKGWLLLTTLEGSSRDGVRPEPSPPTAIASAADRTEDELLVSRAPHPACEVVLPGNASKVADGFRACGEALWPLRERALEVLSQHENARPPTHSAGSVPSSSVAQGDAEGDVPETDTKADEPAALSESAATYLERVTGPDPTLGLLDIADVAPPGGATSGLPEVLAAARSAAGECRAAVAAAAKASGTLAEAPTLGEDDQPEATLGFAACGGVPVKFAPGERVQVGTEQSQSAFCTDLEDDVSLGEQGMRAAAICSIRIATERAARGLRAEARRLAGWKSFDALLQRPPGKKRGYGLALGEAEGHQRGDLFVVEVPTPEGKLDRVGFGRIIEVGPGGDAGNARPSYFKFRSGTVQREARLREWQQLGIRVGPHLRYAFRYVKGDLDAAFPGGVGLTVASDGTRFVRLGDEFWFRVDVGYLVGAAEFGYDDSSVYADLSTEAHFYGSDRLAWVATAGVGASRLSGTYVEDDDSGGAETTAVSGIGAAAILGGGLDVALHPDWSVQGLLRVRQVLHPFEPKGELNGETVHLNASFLGEVELGLTATYTF